MDSGKSDSIVIPRNAVRRAVVVAASGLFVAVLVIAALFVVQRLRASDGIASAIHADEFQAVLLTNGQLYVGRLSAEGGDTYKLTHVYYLAAQSGRSGRPIQRTLLPLVKDVQGPEDMLIIPRAQIVYMENLSAAGNAASLLHRVAP